MKKYLFYFLCLMCCLSACNRYKVPMIPSYQRIPVIQVEPNDTLYSLAKKYDTSVQELARRNNISKPEELKAGQTLSLPSGYQNKINQTASPIAPTLRETDSVAGTQKINKPFIETGKVSFSWPVKGKIISKYGTHGTGIKNDGINISAAKGTAIKAAEKGIVVYAGNELKGYGNLILIRHEKEFMTAYAHADNLTAQTGDVVQKGQIIGHVGASGSVKVPQLHFEIRLKTKSVNPKRYLQ